MRVVSIGDLVTDYYYKNEKFLGINGGMTSHNIIANLAKMGINTTVFGACGNDIQGEIAIKSLEKLGVDVNNIIVLNDVRTRCFHISYFDDDCKLSFTSKKRCPFCNKKKWYENSLINTDDIIKKIKDDDILVFDNLNNKNQILIDKISNKKVIDLGQYFELENLSDKEIINKLNNKFEIINFNERVSKYLIKRFNVNDDVDLYNILKPNFMTITRGEKGATFVSEGIAYNFELKNKGNVIDSTGAGDAFVSSIIRDCIKNNFVYNPNNFEEWYENSNKLTSKVVSKMGARGHINALFKIKNVDNECTCDNFIYNERKIIKRCNININNLETRIKNAVNSSAASKINEMDFDSKNNCLFVGTGGSYAAAYFASRVVNQLYGSNTFPIYPRDIIYRNNDNIDRVIVFSYSGTTSDIINSVSKFDKKNIFVITKGEIQKIVLKTSILKKNIISYRTSSNKGKERGFLSFEGAVAPSAIYFKHYIDKTNSNIDINKFISESINNWNTKIYKLLNNNFIDVLKEKN